MIEASSFDFSKLIIATNNIGKLREFEALLVDLPLVIAGQPQDLDVDESGNSFAANARIKAVAAALATGEWALADDRRSPGSISLLIYVDAIGTK